MSEVLSYHSGSDIFCLNRAPRSCPKKGTKKQKTKKKEAKNKTKKRAPLLSQLPLLPLLPLTLLLPVRLLLLSAENVYVTFERRCVCLTARSHAQSRVAEAQEQHGESRKGASLTFLTWFTSRPGTRRLSWPGPLQDKAQDKTLTNHCLTAQWQVSPWSGSLTPVHGYAQVNASVYIYICMHQWRSMKRDIEKCGVSNRSVWTSMISLV